MIDSSNRLRMNKKIIIHHKILTISCNTIQTPKKRIEKKNKENQK